MPGEADNQVSDKLVAEAGHCKFYLEHKKRVCGWPAKKGREYCGNHVFEATGTTADRVACPANPKQ